MKRSLQLVLAGLVFLTASCEVVKPWQRGNLAKPVMDPGRVRLETAMAEHLYFSREASSGGAGVGGGGCGCN